MRHAKIFVIAIVVAGLAGCRSGRNADSYVTASPASPSVTTTVVAHEPAPEPPGPVASAQSTFESPEAALTSLAAAAEAADHDATERILGGDCRDLLESGDEAADHDDCVRVAAMIRERVEFEDGSSGRRFAVIGDERWRFPVPVARTSSGWEFDVDAGRDELLTARIGWNELITADALEELVVAQREYSAESRDGNPRAFACKFQSTDGKHDGLHWAAPDGARGSPLGPSIAAAAAESRPAGPDPIPFHGYYYKPLTGQGQKAPGGDVSYVDAEGRMTGGCAALAWPASYGDSGVMTFIVNHAGIVYEKDLGPKTDEIVAAMTKFEPDETWRPTER